MKEWMKETEFRHLFPEQIEQTAHNLSDVAVQAFFPKTSYKRFKSHVQSIEFILNNVKTKSIGFYHKNTYTLFLFFHILSEPCNEKRGGLIDMMRSGYNQISPNQGQFPQSMPEYWGGYQQPMPYPPPNNHNLEQPFMYPYHLQDTGGYMTPYHDPYQHAAYHPFQQIPHRRCLWGLIRATV